MSYRIPVLQFSAVTGATENPGLRPLRTPHSLRGVRVVRFSHRFTMIDANFMTVGKDVAQLRADLGNDIAWRRAVANACSDIAQSKATLIEFRERIDRIEANVDGRKHT